VPAMVTSDIAVPGSGTTAARSVEGCNEALSAAHVKIRCDGATSNLWAFDLHTLTWELRETAIMTSISKGANGRF
jgi:hypothetical protein